MTKKGHQKFWQMKTEILADEKENLFFKKSEVRNFCYLCSCKLCLK